MSMLSQPVDRRTECQVAGEDLTMGDAFAARQVRINYRECLGGALQGCPYRVGVPLFWRLAGEAEKAYPESGPKGSQLRVHPPLRERAVRRVLAPERASAVTGAEVVDDGVRLAQ